MMPNIVPGVRWHPINVAGRAKRRKGRGLVGHVAVSSSKNLVPGPNADWHFYLPKEGPAIQYIDLDLQCWATGAGNASLVAFESEGGLGTAAQVNAEPWTDNQLNWAAKILRYLADTEGVPLRVMASSHTTERGFGTHRLGVPGYMVAGGELWSSSRGKLCPGDAKHAQRFEVVRRAQAIGSKAPTPTPVPELGDLDMFVLRDPNSSILLYTPISLYPIGSQVLSGAAQKILKTGITDVTWAELDALAADVKVRRNELALSTWAYVGADGGVDAYQRLNDIKTKALHVESLVAQLGEDGIPGGVSVGPDDLAAALARPEVAAAIGDALADKVGGAGPDEIKAAVVEVLRQGTDHAA